MLHFFKFFFSSSKNRVPILMYHQVLPQSLAYPNDLIVTVENLEQQFQYIKANFTTVFFKDLEKSQSFKNKIILTFDDGYYNNLEYLIPLLKKYEMKATIFIPTQLIEKNQSEDKSIYMNFDEIRLLDSDWVEIALHSHSHRNFSELSLEDSEKDLIQNMEVLERNNIRFSNILAYPYGKFPRDSKSKSAFFSMLESIGIVAALRIGNRVESYPFRNRFEVNRIDIKYSDSLKIFKRKLKFGKPGF